MTVSLQMEIVVKGKEDASKIFDNIKRSAGDAEVSLKKVTDTTKSNSMAFTELNSALMLAKAAFSMISQVVKATVGAYMEAEDSLNRMAAAMRMSGSTSDKALESMVRFSKTLGELTRFEDDAALGLMSMGKAAGYSDETVKAMTLAAANLSAVTKKDLATSFDALMMSLNGQTRGIKMLLPELKGMSDEAIKAGGAINLINEKLKDAAVNEQGLSVSSEKLANSFGNMMESIGKVIAEAIDLRGIFDGLASLFNKLGKAVESVDFRKLADGLREAIPFIISSTVALGVLLSTFTGLSTLMMGGTIAQGIAKITFGLRAAWVAAAPFLLIAAKILLIVAAIVAVAVAIDQLVRNFSRLGDVWALVWNVMQQVSLRAMAMIYDKLAEIAWMFGGNAESWREKSRQMIRDADDLKSKFKVSKDELTSNWDTGFVGKIIDAFKGVGKSAEEGGNKAALGGNKAKVALTGITEAAKKAAEELKKVKEQVDELGRNTSTLNAENARWNKTGIQVLRMDFDAEIAKIGMLRQQLIALKAYTPKASGALASAEEANKQRTAQKIADEIEKGRQKSSDLIENMQSIIEQFDKARTADPFNAVTRDAEEKVKALAELFQKYISNMKEFELIPIVPEANVKKEMTRIQQIATNTKINLKVQADIQQVTNFVGALTSGSKATIAYVSNLKVIADRFGAIGQLIGGIIEFFNRPPDEFRKGVKELFDGIIKQLIPNILKNIPVLLEVILSDAIPSAINLIFNQLNDLVPRLIFGIIKSLGDGIGEIFRSIVVTIINHVFGENIKMLGRSIRDAWKEIFLGKKAKKPEDETLERTTTVTTKYKKVTDTAAGRDEFKVREYEASETVTKTWEKRVKDATDDSGETLAESIIDAWRQAMANVREAFDAIKKIVGDITEGLTSGIIMGLGAGVLTILGAIGYAVGALIVGPFMAIISLLKGNSIVDAASEIDKSGMNFANFFFDKRKKFANWVRTSAKETRTEAEAGMPGTKSGSVFSLDGEEQPTSFGLDSGSESPADMFGGAGEQLLSGLGGDSGGGSLLYGLGGDLLQGLLDKTEQATTWALELGGKIWTGLWSWAEKATEWMQELGGKIWNGLWAWNEKSLTWMQELGGKIWSGLWSFNESALTWAQTIGVKLWNGFWNMVGAGDSWAAQTGLKLWNGFWNMTKDATKWAGDTGLAIWNGLWNMTKDITKWAGDAGLAIWNGLWNNTSKITSWATDAGAAIWNGFWNLTSKGLDWAASIGTKIFDSFGIKFDGIGNALSKMFSFDGKGTGVVEKFLGFDFPFVNFAEGGFVPGRARVSGDSLQNDRVPAMLSPGEMVVPRSVLDRYPQLADVLMSAMGGQDIGFHGFGTWLKKTFVPKKPADIVKIVVGIPPGAPVPPAVNKAATAVAQVTIPENIQQMFNSISRFASNIDIMKMITNPAGILNDAIKGSIGAFKPYFSQMMHRFANGGEVPGFGFSDSVPALLTPGEHVLTRDQASAMRSGGMGGTTVVLNISPGADVSESAIRRYLVPAVIDAIDRQSINGKRFVNARGVY